MAHPLVHDGDQPSFYVAIQVRELIEYEGRRIEHEYVVKIPIPQVPIHKVDSGPVGKTQQSTKPSLFKKIKRRTYRGWKIISLFGPLPLIDKIFHPDGATWLQQAAELLHQLSTTL